MSKLRQALRGRPGLESIDPTVQVSTTSEDGTVASAIVDLNQDNYELEKDQDHIADVQEAAASLESLICSLEEIADAGGLTADGAVIANHAVDAILAPVGETAEEVMPSLESFGATSNRRTSTRISVESLKAKLVEIWEYIKDLIKKARVRIKDWYLKVWSAAPALKKRAEAIRLKAEAIKAAPKDGANAKINISGVAGKIQIEGKIPNDLPAQVGAISTIADTLYGNTYGNAVKTFATSVIAGVEDLKFDTDTAFEGSLTKLKAVTPINITGLADGTIATTDKRFGNVGAGLVCTKSATLPGDKMIVLTKGAAATGGAAPSTRDLLEKTLGKHQYQLVDAGDKRAEKTTQDEITLLSGTNIAAIADKIVTLAMQIEKYEKGWQETDRLKDQVTKAGDRLAKDAEKAKDLNAANTGIAGAAIRLMQSINNVIDQPAQQFTSYVMSTSAAFLTVCDKCLVQYN